VLHKAFSDLEEKNIFKRKTKTTPVFSFEIAKI
jgi:hypothetical protein